MLHFIIICRVFRAAPASSPTSPVAGFGVYAERRRGTSFRRLLAYKVLQTASVSCRAAGSLSRSFLVVNPTGMSEMEHSASD